MFSRVGIFKIQSDGQIEPYGEVENAHAGSMFICRTLSGKYECPFDPFGVYRAQAVSQLFGAKEMSERDSIVLGFTFDRVWVRQENLARLADALESFYSENSTYLSLNGQELPVPPTLLQIAEMLRKASREQDLRGTCFSQTSVAWNLWKLRDKKSGEDRFFHFDRDQTTRDQGVPWELFEGLQSKQTGITEISGC